MSDNDTKPLTEAAISSWDLGMFNMPLAPEADHIRANLRNRATSMLRRALAEIAELRAEVEEAWSHMLRCKKERHDALDARTTEGLSAAEWQMRTGAAERARREAEAQKNAAYGERDRLVCALSKVFPSWLARHPDADASWEDDWRWIVFVQLPTGQASWHIHDSEREWFDHLSVGENSWDGHTNEVKYQRLANLPAAPAMSSDQPTRWFLDQDNDCHWYLVRWDKRHVWYEWCDLPSEDPDAWEPPEGVAKRIGGAPSLVIFTNPEEVDE